LLAGNDQSVRHALHSFLKAHDFAVIEAADGLDALDRTADHGGRIDLVMTDYLLHRLNGLELRGRLFMMYPTIPVILFSTEIDQLLTCHPDLIVFPKPFDPHLLVLKIRELLKPAGA
jgi:DNA-binding response OmpR family regulator